MLAMRITATAVLTIVTVLLVSLPSADARHSHDGFGHGAHGDFGLHGAVGAHARMDRAGLAGDRQHANDSYVNAANAEEDKLPDTKIKSICRGC
jgi:hypothetical protein